MITAIAIDSKGNEIGSPRMFPETQWNSMVRTNGKRLRWRLIDAQAEDTKEEPEISKEESDKIWGEENSEPIFEKELEKLTKREIIEKYYLSKDLMKLTKAKIINEILK